MTKQNEFPFRNQLRQHRDWWTRIDMTTLLRDSSYNRRLRKPLEPTTFVLIACSKSKLTKEAPARDLYTGQLFRKATIWAERQNLQWYVVSALHGLVKPDQLIEPYDYTIKDLRGRIELEQWAHRVVDCELTRYIAKASHAILILPRLYRHHIERQLLKHHITYENPLEHLGIGKQIQWLARN